MLDVGGPVYNEIMNLPIPLAKYACSGINGRDLHLETKLVGS